MWAVLDLEAVLLPPVSTNRAWGAPHPKSPESEPAAVRQSHQTKSLPDMAPEGRLSSLSQAHEAGLPFELEKACI